MTIQAGDILSYSGEKTTIATEPLKPYLKTRSDVGFIYKSTALVRGYIGTWEIKSKKLYLVSLVGFIDNNEKVDLNYLFPNKTEVFADWFSGDIRIPEGELLEKINLGYASVFEKDRILTFKEGILISETVKNNTKSNNINHN
tara:strand:- start:383 stop:811 length:429 start_codon:yes stop_codon:yes gene_type:complete